MLTGSCHCGAVAYEVDAPAGPIHPPSRFIRSQARPGMGYDPAPAVNRTKDSLVTDGIGAETLLQASVTFRA
jgi:hypothetical protein